LQTTPIYTAKLLGWKLEIKVASQSEEFNLAEMLKLLTDACKDK